MGTSLSSSKIEAMRSWAGLASPHFPTLNTIGLLHSDVWEVVDAFGTWQAQLGRSPRAVELNTQSFDQSLLCILPLTLGERRRWLFAKVGEWTVVFDNGARGSDPLGLLMVVGKALSCTTVIAGVDLPEGLVYPATSLSIFEQPGSLSPTRYVAAVDDGGSWRFDSTGEPLAFEDVERYDKRKIRDRFTPLMLDDYLLSYIGTNVFCMSSYSRPYVLVSRGDPRVESSRDLSRAEARALVKSV